jgi:hypothetical protein
VALGNLGRSRYLKVYLTVIISLDMINCNPFTCRILLASWEALYIVYI